jgi:adenosylcobinamide-GDP ribazoletransferase
VSSGHTARDTARLAFGTLTVLPTRPPASVDRRVASRAMVLAPLVGAVLGVLAGGTLWLLDSVGPGLPGPSSLFGRGSGDLWTVGPALAAAVTIGLLALLTRGMHLDGLADTADGLGSGKEAAPALEVMRRGDVGPFGVVTLVLVLLVQVLALADLVAAGAGAAGLVLALVASRLALPVACSRGVPAARADGLGHGVAGTVSRPQLAASLLLALLLGSFALAVAEPPNRDFAAVAVGAGTAATAGLAGAVLVTRRAVRRFGGVTGDVLGACVEVTFTVTLVVLALLV